MRFRLYKILAATGLFISAGGLSVALAFSDSIPEPQPLDSPQLAVSPATVVQDDDAAGAVAEEEEPVLRKFMRQKLKASNQILEGLMVDNLQMVDQAAGKLLQLSKQEKWRASNDMMYLQHSREFRTAVEEMQKKAKRQSMDGTSLAWINVTMKCIQCHEWVRNTVVADAGSVERPDRTRPGQTEFFRGPGGGLRN